MDKRQYDDVFIEQAETEAACIRKIRARFGMNYQIIRKRSTRSGGFLGFFAKDGFEISFMPTVPPQKLSVPEPARSSPSSPVQAAVAGNRTTSDFDAERKKILAGARPDLQMMLVLDEVRAIKNQLDGAQLGAKGEDHETIKKLEVLLEKNEFTSSYISLLLGRVRREFSLEQLDDFDLVQETLVEWIGENICVNDPCLPSKPQVFILVGPTGVGKTTTVAKLAAKYVMQTNFTSRPLNVRLITIDNFRIAAQQQIEKYGSIMGIPVSVAESSDDLKKLLAMYNNEVDLIIIDTIGYSPRDFSKIAEMRSMLDSTISPQVFLTFSASTKTSDISTVMQQFETFGYDSVIITKFDETTYVGNIISLLHEKNKPVSFITTGQRVPNDIEKASPVKFLIQLVDFKIDRDKIDQKFEKGSAQNFNY